ncbi:MAG: FAD-dependent oxidoreductase [Planctomycetaceae bacterium]|nr:FAD-dependent oxidoreductase [Planctomycetaceae bacterium]
MKIGIIGSGISGLTAAWILNRHHDVTVLEASDRVGGHTNTVSVDDEGKSLDVDTGFIVYNDRTYPNFIRLLSALGLQGQPTAMSFSVSCEESGLEYCGSGLSGLFCQKRNLLNPSFLRMLGDILRFNKLGSEDAVGDQVPDDMTVGEYLRFRNLGRWFAEKYLLPMGAAIWSCPVGAFEQFPIRFILEFYLNHGLLAVRNRPTWRTIPGGSRQYVDRILGQLDRPVRLGEKVVKIIPRESMVSVFTRGNVEFQFDEVIVACHSDQALRMLDAPTKAQQEILTGFPYSKSTAVLHTDTRLLPRRQAAWSSWNYRILKDQQDLATVTYDMNILQHLATEKTYCVTLNHTEAIRDECVLAEFNYSHPIFTTSRHRLQQRHNELIRANRLSFCGAYWGNGFHEDGVNSALSVCQGFGIGRDWDQPTLLSDHVRNSTTEGSGHLPAFESAENEFRGQL